MAGSDCIVVGGGLCGMLSAALLRAAGARVLLVEQNRVGEGPPAVEAGLLGLTHPWRDPLPVSALAHRGRKVYPEFLADLCEFTEIDLGYYEGPVLVLDSAERQVALDWSARHGCEVSDLTPWKDDGGHGTAAVTMARAGLMVGHVPRVRGDAMLRALRRGLELQGVELMEGVAARGLLQQRGSVGGVVTEHGAIDAEQVVLACGDGIVALLRALQQSPALCASDRELAVYEGDIDVAEGVVAYGGAVMILASDAAYLEYDAGSVGWEQAKRLSGFLGARSPSPTSAWQIRHLATADAVPCVGEHPELPGLFLNVGHAGHAGATGLPGAHLLLELMTQQTPSLDPTPYRVDRQLAEPRLGRATAPMDQGSSG